MFLLPYDMKDGDKKGFSFKYFYEIQIVILQPFIKRK